MSETLPGDSDNKAENAFADCHDDEPLSETLVVVAVPGGSATSNLCSACQSGQPAPTDPGDLSLLHICLDCHTVLCAVCYTALLHDATHVIAPFPAASATIIHSARDLLDTCRERVGDLEARLNTLRLSSGNDREPSLIPRLSVSRPAAAGLRRTASHNGGGSATSLPLQRNGSFRGGMVPDADVDRARLLKEAKVRLEGSAAEIDGLLREGGSAAAVLRLAAILKEGITVEGVAVAEMSSEQDAGSSTVRTATATAVSQPGSVMAGGGERATTWVCAVTSGLARDGTVTTVPGREVKLRLYLWSRDIRSRPPATDQLTCRLEMVSHPHHRRQRGSASPDQQYHSHHHQQHCASSPCVTPDMDRTGLIDTCKSPIEEEEPIVQLHPRQLRTDTFELTFRLERESTYRLHICMSGCPVNGSPYTVLVKSPAVREEAIRESLFSPCWSTASSVVMRPGYGRSQPGSTVSSSHKRHSLGASFNHRTVSDIEEDDLLIRRIGQAGREPGCFLNPQDVCLVNEKCIAVTDSNIGCIQLFSLDGIFLKRIGERGRRPGQIIRPTGIAFLPKCQNRWEEDVLVVADYENRTVVLFSVDSGQSLTSFGAARLTGPKGVAVAANGDIIVVDNRSNSVFVFRSCKLFKKLWSPSTTAAHLAGPHYVTVTRDTGDILVSDFHHHTIKVFDALYTYRWSFGSFNVNPGMGSFSGPTGVAADQRGIAVADWGSGRIQIFDSAGSFLAYVTTLASPLYGPQGLAISHDGTIFACDSGNHTVRVYRHPLA